MQHGTMPSWPWRRRLAGEDFGYITAIAATRGSIVASRDTVPYDEAVSVKVIHPWARE
jgi:hypothetical protein